MADALAFPSSSPADLLSRFRATSPTLVQDKIKCAFDNYKLECLEGFVQFWAPVKTTGGRWLLTTSDQPFAITENHNGGKKYRLCSVRYQYNIDMNNLEVEEDPAIINGAPATAFLNRMPVLLPDLRVHRMSPLESCAVQCGSMFRSLLLPVFYPSESCCVGVVEFCTSMCYHLLYTFNDLMAALKEEGLKMFARPYQTICGLQHARDVIKEAFDIIWPKFHLDFAQVWIAYKDEDHVTFSSSLEDTQRKRMLGIKLIDRYGERESYGGDYYVYEGFSYYGSICNKLPLKMGEGLIGKTLQNCKPQFIKKVSRLRDNEPLMLVRYQDFQGIDFECSCFVICLRSTETNDLDYVFEFLWHEVPDHAILLESLLLLLKECLPSFKYAPRGELGDELRIIDVENSIDNKIESFTIFRGNKSSLTLEALEKSSVVKDCITPLEVKCKTYPISLSQGGMIEAAKNPDVSLSPLKRKRKDQSNTNEEDKGASQDPSANNREMYLDENALTIKAEYADDMIKFTLPISSATFVAIQKEIGKGFELNPANYKIKYLDEDGDWILLKSDEDMKVCIKGRRNLTSIVRLRLVARQPSYPSHTYQAT